MSKGSKNTFLPIYFGVLGVGALGLGYLAYSASDGASEAQDEFKKAQTELSRLEKEPLSRTEENAVKKKELVDKYLAQVNDLNGVLRKYQASPTDTPDPVAFQKKLQKFAADINKAAKDKNVKLPDKFDFGMNKYLSDFAPDSKTAQALSAHLEALNFITATALEAGIRSVDAMSRDEIAIEKEIAAAPATGTGANRTANNTNRPANRPATGTAARPAAGGAANRQAAKPTAPVLDESKVLERQAVRMTVTGKHQSVTALLEKLANTSPETAPHFITIRNLRIENEVKTGTPKTMEVKAEEVKPEGQPPYIKDAVYILGNQAVKAYLDMDIIRFLDEESPAKPNEAAPAAPTAR